jgi:hypothetical protein
VSASRRSVAHKRERANERDRARDPAANRFRANKIIRDLEDQGVIDLNKVAAGGYSAADRMQLAQLIGYSVSGYGDLSYASRKSVRLADEIAEKLIRKKGADR